MKTSVDTRHRAGIARAASYIEANLAAPLRADKIARHAGMSAFHFQRLFSACMGEPVQHYITARRLEAAARALAAGRAGTVLDTALACGFETHSAFSKAFRTRFGLSPSAFRKDPGAARTAPETSRRFLITDPPRRMIAPIAQRDLPTFHFLYRTAQGTDDGQFFKGQEADVIAQMGALFRGTHPPDLFLMSGFPAAPQTLSDAHAAAWFGGAFTARVPSDWSPHWRRFDAGHWAVFEHAGPPQFLYQTWNRIYRNWLPRAQVQLRDDMPFEVYVMPEGAGTAMATRTHIYIPVRKA